MIDQSKNILIGIFVVAATAVFAWVLMFLHPTVGDGEGTLKVRFSDVDKVTLGTRVLYAGKPIGEVVQVELVQEGREGRADRMGRLYMYELTLNVDSSVEVYDIDEVMVFTSGLLGERSVAIIPRLPEPEEKIRLINNEIIYAKSAGSVEHALSIIDRLAKKAETALDAVANLVETNNEDLNTMLKNASETLGNLDISLKRANEKDLVGTVQEAADHFGDSMEALKIHLDEIQEKELWDKVASVSENLRSITDAVNQPENLEQIVKNVKQLSERLEGSWDKVDQSLNDLEVVMDNAKEISEDGKGIVKHLADGQGTLGKLIYQDDLYLRTTSVMSKAETLMNDVNHYGVLFHLDKGWQRTRTKRANKISELRTSDQFRNYFEEEVDQINTSLSRVAMLLKQADEKDTRQEVITDKKFQETFADLLRQVDGLEQTLQHYNEMLIESQSS